MKHILLLFLSFFAPVVWGQQVEQFKLWPDKPEAGEAEIFVYHPAKGGKAAPAVLICPGGGYRGLAMNHEGHDMAKWYASNGFVAVVLKYRMPEGVHTIPLSDAEKAMSVIRAMQPNGTWMRISRSDRLVGRRTFGSFTQYACSRCQPAGLCNPLLSGDQLR